MSTRYFCRGKERLESIRRPEWPDPKGGTMPAQENGIDYLEVDPSQKELSVHFLHPLPGSGAANAVPGGEAKPLVLQNLVIEGGVRVRGIEVCSVTPQQGVDNVLTVHVDRPGDFSTYTLRLITSATDRQPPDGFDSRLAAVDFSFKVGCPSDFDCLSRPVCPPEVLAEPEIDYLAKDYDSFRRLMLDRLTMLMPDWQERSPADQQVMLVELLAYVADRLSYYQDAVANEAYLGTARRRISVRRHARLLDYAMHDGCNARTWVVFEAGPGADGKFLGKGTPVLSGASARAVVDPADLRTALAQNPMVFETMTDVTLHSSHDAIEVYTWGDTNCCLPRGSTRATLSSQVGSALCLDKGDFLLFEEIISPTTGLPADANPGHRQVVRLTEVQPATDPWRSTEVLEIEWAADDALTFPLCLSATLSDGAGQGTYLPSVSVARGNIALADHGLTVPDSRPLTPAVVPAEGKYRPYLDASTLTMAVPLDEVDARTGFKPSAAACLRCDCRSARPGLCLEEVPADGTPPVDWYPSDHPDLLSYGATDARFVVETESDGVPHLRFGDGTHGRAPMPGSTFAANGYRLGNGAAGNIGAEVLGRVVTAVTGITRVRNPIAAAGGTDPEPIDSVRAYAPHAFRRLERAVTPADYAELAQRHPEVQKAAATLRWTGSWYTMFVTIDRVGGRAVDAAFEADVRAHLERYRLAGYDLEVDGPVSVPLDLALQVCVKPGYFRSDVKQALLAALGSTDLPDGSRGFFHPDNFTFGQPVYLSSVYALALSIAGVQSADVTRFQRWGKAAAREIDEGVLIPARLEVVRLDNDPSVPENGVLKLEMQGGM